MFRLYERLLSILSEEILILLTLPDPPPDEVVAQAAVRVIAATGTLLGQAVGQREIPTAAEALRVRLGGIKSGGAQGSESAECQEILRELRQLETVLAFWEKQTGNEAQRVVAIVESEIAGLRTLAAEHGCLVPHIPKAI